jgi:hypothetical protein
MQKKGILYVTLILVLFYLSIPNEVYACTKDNLSASIGIDFFNRFQSNETGLYTEAFQRYHTMTVEYDQNPWSVQLIYNWLDIVLSQNSTHTLNLYGIDLYYQISENRTLVFDYQWSFNIFTRGLDSREIRLDMVSVFPISNSWTSECRYGLLWNDRQLKYDVGAKITFRTICHLSINYLTPQDSLVLEKDSSKIIPASFGAIFKLNNYNSLEVTYTFNLVPGGTGINQWLKTSFHFQI